MSGVQIDIVATGFDKAVDVLNKLEQAGKNLRPVWDDIGVYLGSELQQRFQDSEAPDGTPWKVSKRAATEVDGKTLVDHAILRDSFTHNVFPDDSGLQFGTNVIYAGIHQFGGDTGRNKSVTLPARPMLSEQFNSDDSTEILAIVTRHLQKAL